MYYSCAMSRSGKNASTPARTTANRKKVTDNILLGFMQFHANLKIIHLCTNNYAIHKASDKLYKQFGKRYDKFVEGYFGIAAMRARSAPKIRVNGELKVETLEDSEVPAYCHKFIDFLENCRRSIEQSRGGKGLLTIIDDMESDIYQFVYIATKF